MATLLHHVQTVSLHHKRQNNLSSVCKWNMKSEERAQFPIHAELTGDSYKEFISPSLLL